MLAWCWALSPQRVLGSRVCRYVVYATVVSMIVTWSYVIHQSTLYKEDDSSTFVRSPYPPVQILAPKAFIDVDDKREEDLVPKLNLETADDTAPIIDFHSSSKHTGVYFSGVRSQPGDKRTSGGVIDSSTHDKKSLNEKQKEIVSHKQSTQVKVIDSEFDSEMDVLAIEQDFLQRSQQVKSTCRKYGLGVYHQNDRRKTLRYPPSANYDVLYIDRPDGLTWCPVYKAASTSWLHNLCLLAGATEGFLASTKQQISTTARRLWPQLDYDDAVKAVPLTTKFMIVRHPFDRLVSVYRDKFENMNIGHEHGTQHFYEAYGKKIVQKYRTPNSTLSRVRLPSNKDDPEPQGVEPTFKEFVKFIIDSDLVHHSDDHWMPYYLYCTPCYINYNVIAKFETLERDQRYLLRTLHLEHKIQPKWKHLTRGQKTTDIVREYFKTISKRDLKKLALKYKIDFEMYNYTLAGYL